MNKPLISVIIPVYKVEQYLADCVDSVIAQSYKKLEIILVNDGSPDDCGWICDQYASQDPRVQVIHKANGGLSDARNAGLEKAKGEFIAFVDSDDIVHERFIELLYAKMGGADMAFCDYQAVVDAVEANAFENDMDDGVILRRFSGNKVLSNMDNLIRKESPIVTLAWNKLYKRRLWDTLRYPKGRIHEDEFVIHHLIFRCDRIHFLPAKLYYYRQRGDSIIGSTSRDLKAASDKIEAYLDRRDFFRAKRMRKEVKHLNGKILYRCMMPSIPPDIYAWKGVGARMILFENNLPIKYRACLILKKFYYRAYLKMVNILRK